MSVFNNDRLNFVRSKDHDTFGGGENAVFESPYEQGISGGNAKQRFSDLGLDIRDANAASMRDIGSWKTRSMNASRMQLAQGLAQARAGMESRAQGGGFDVGARLSANQAHGQMRGDVGGTRKIAANQINLADAMARYGQQENYMADINQKRRMEVEAMLAMEQARRAHEQGLDEELQHQEQRAAKGASTAISGLSALA